MQIEFRIQFTEGEDRLVRIDAESINHAWQSRALHREISRAVAQRGEIAAVSFSQVVSF